MGLFLLFLLAGPPSKAVCLPVNAGGRGFESRGSRQFLSLDLLVDPQQTVAKDGHFRVFSTRWLTTEQSHGLRSLDLNAERGLAHSPSGSLGKLDIQRIDFLNARVVV